MVPGGVYGPGGGIPACTEADPPVNRITHTSKNITLATTSLRPIINDTDQSRALLVHVLTESPACFAD